MDRSSHDYLAHISNIIKAPSLIHGAPQYPNVHKAFNHDHSVYEKLQQAKPRTKKRVQLMDPAGRAIVEYDLEVDHDTTADSEADDGFFQQKQKNFELCKWKTFRM